MVPVMLWCLSVFAPAPTPPVSEPACLWAALANQESLDKHVRAYCVHQLFRRHVRPGMKVAELARLLDNPTWLRKHDIHRHHVVAGYVPVPVRFNASLYDLWVFPELDKDMRVIYLSIFPGEGADLVGALQDQPAGASADAVILEIGFCWYRMRQPGGK